MEPVVTVNLNGNPYALDQSAHDALKAYLDAAEAALASNPDKAEIMRDLEQAIADKCRAYMSPHKTVISADEMKKALAEMGPVEGAEQAQAGGDDSGAGAQTQAGGAKKRIYRITEGASVAGVCAGLAAYFDINVGAIRLLFVLATVVTSGAFILVYIAMMFLIPSAQTSEQWAEAHGIPFNAQEVIDSAKRQYQDFTQNGPPWWGPRAWRNQHRHAWKRQVRDQARAWRDHWRYGPATAAPTGPISYAGSVIGGVLALVFTFIRVIVAIIFFAFLISLVTTGHIGYYELPPKVEVWQAILVLVLVYAIISIPLRAMRWAAWGMMGRPYYGYRGGEGVIVLVAFVAIAWLAYQHVPEAHFWMDRARDAANHVLEDLRHDFSN